MAMMLGDSALSVVAKIILHRGDDRRAGIIGDIQITKSVQRSRQKIHHQYKCYEEPARKAQQRQALKMKR